MVFHLHFSHFLFQCPFTDTLVSPSLSRSRSLYIFLHLALLFLSPSLSLFLSFPLPLSLSLSEVAAYLVAIETSGTVTEAHSLN